MKPPPLVVNVGCYFDYPYEKQRSAQLGIEMRWTPAHTGDEIVAAGAEATILLLEDFEPITAAVLDRLPRCQAIVKYAVGVDTIDIAAASDRGIVVANSADFCTEEVSDHAAALLLASARQIMTMDRTIRAGGWEEFPRIAPLRRLAHLTLGVIGLGRIGRRLAEKMSAFGLRLLVVDPQLTPCKVPAGMELVPLDRLLSEADLISVHVPLTSATRGLVGERELRLMKPTAFIVNTSRGPIINQAALTRALQERWIAGAALDVMEEEPLPAASPLRSLDNIVVTPHFSGQSVDSIAHLHRSVMDSVEALLGGYWPPFPLNPKISPRRPLRPWVEFRQVRGS
ncbi:MAG: Glycerate dehydrogenase [Nitrospira sp.]|nr:Glycerate dehydrogenase [Nitrospira sp.]